MTTKTIQPNQRFNRVTLRTKFKDHDIYFTATGTGDVSTLIERIKATARGKYPNLGNRRFSIVDIL